MTQRLWRFIPVALLLTLGCKKAEKDALLKPDTSLAYIIPTTFDWETVEWMPTPPGQSQIAPPWSGQGSIGSTYSIDVLNDHKKIDGWELVYNTFDANAPAVLVNPYFILYNKYRGLMRIYLYTTTPFVSPSSNVVDGMSITSTVPTRLLNFLGTEVVDPAAKRTVFSQVEPAPADGSAPLASGKWYMLQYEMAYDPDIKSNGLTSDNIRMSWFTNFNSISAITLGGNLTGTVKTAVGAPDNGIGTALTNGGKVAGTGALAWIGQTILQNNGNSSTGVNNLGLGVSTYKNILKGLEGAVSSASGSFPGALVNIFSAILGGNSSSPTVSMNIDANITMTGTETTHGSFPSSPTTLYVPGSKILSTAQNYVPLVNDQLGVFNLTARPVIDLSVVSDDRHNHNWPPGTDKSQVGVTYHAAAPENNLVVYNPDVINDNIDGATVMRYTEEPVFIMWDSIGGVYNPMPVYLTDLVGRAQWEQKGNSPVISSTDDLTDSNIGFTFSNNVLAGGVASYALGISTTPDKWMSHGFAIRATVVLKPNNSNKYITIVKTFAANVRCHAYLPDGSVVDSPIGGF